MKSSFQKRRSLFQSKLTWPPLLLDLSDFRRLHLIFTVSKFLWQSNPVWFAPPSHTFFHWQRRFKDWHKIAEEIETTSNLNRNRCCFHFLRKSFANSPKKHTSDSRYYTCSSVQRAVWLVHFDCIFLRSKCHQNLIFFIVALFPVQSALWAKPAFINYLN